MKEYFCHQWPEYSISGKVRFVNGWFRTDDPDLIAIVRSNDMFGVYIWDASGEDHVKETKTEAGADSEALREVSHDDQERGEGIPPLQQESTGQTSRAGAVIPGGSNQQGRETGHVFQELEEVVRGSGIIGGKGRKEQPRSGEGSKGSASDGDGADLLSTLKVEPGE